MFVLDSHCDTPTQILRGRDLSKDNELAHIDIPKLRQGGVDAAFFALYVPADLDVDAAYECACRQYEAVKEMVESNSDSMALPSQSPRHMKISPRGFSRYFLDWKTDLLLANP